MSEPQRGHYQFHPDTLLEAAERSQKARIMEADLYEARQRLANAERRLRDLGYERCTAPACNCSSYHRVKSE